MTYTLLSSLKKKFTTIFNQKAFLKSFKKRRKYFANVKKIAKWTICSENIWKRPKPVPYCFLWLKRWLSDGWLMRSSTFMMNLLGNVQCTQVFPDDFDIQQNFKMFFQQFFHQFWIFQSFKSQGRHIKLELSKLFFKFCPEKLLNLVL